MEGDVADILTSRKEPHSTGRSMQTTLRSLYQSKSASSIEVVKTRKS